MTAPTLFDPPADLGHYQRIEWEYPALRQHRTFSVEWYRAYRAEHLARYPDADASTRANLDMFVAIAEARGAA